jgi:hypothetical protein
MPFTVAHIAAVLPGFRSLTRARIFTAAVIGSMVPDFGLLLPLTPTRLQTHSATALITFSLPVGLLAYWLTIYLLKPAIVEILPDAAYLRVRASDASAPPAGPWRWLLTAGAILLGAATHIIWDGFTHENARGVRMFPVLDEGGPEIDGHPLQLYHWLQYGSSVVGLALVIMATVMWLRHAPSSAMPVARPLPAREREGWLSLYLLLPLLALVTMTWRLHHAGMVPQPLSRALGMVAVLGMRAGAVTLLVLSLLLRVRLSLGRPAPRS